MELTPDIIDLIKTLFIKKPGIATTQEGSSHPKKEPIPAPSFPTDKNGFRMYDDRIHSPFSQLDVIRSIVCDENDTFAVIPTGSGKSLCFQAAAILMEGITIVVTPLTALIQDQVNGFNEKMKDAEETMPAKKKEHFRALHMGMNHKSRYEILQMMSENTSDKKNRVKYKLLYISPEQLLMPKFHRMLIEACHTIKISQLVIDEAHCYSDWGFSFRDSYLMLHDLVKEIPERPVISVFTATASKYDEQIITRTLPFHPVNRTFFHCIKARTELELICIKVEDDYPHKDENGNQIKPHTTFPRRKETIRILKAYFKDQGNGSEAADVPKKHAVIYCTNKGNVNKLHQYLVNHCHWLSLMTGDIGKYLADMSSSTKKNTLKKDPNIIVATQAFGMGIDIKNIGLIIHYDIPNTIEEYVQQIGRAARDGCNTAKCYILYTAGDKNPYFYGSLQKTEQIISSTKNLLQLETLPIISGLSQESKDFLHDRSIYRFQKVKSLIDPNRDYDKKTNSSNVNETECTSAAGSLSEAELTQWRHEYIQEYWNSDEYLINDTGKDINGFINDVNDLLDSTYLLHVNNTEIANFLRWHAAPTDYDINRRKELTINEWKRAKGRSFRLIHKDDFDENTLIFINPEHGVFRSFKPIITIVKKWEQESRQKIRLVVIIDNRNIITEICKIDDSGKYKKVSEADDIYIKYMRKAVIIPEVMAEQPVVEEESKKKDEEKTENNVVRNNDIGAPCTDPAGNQKKLYTNSPEISVEKWPVVFIEGSRTRKIYFTINAEIIDESNRENLKPSYWDMCVADAVYSVMQKNRSIIYVREIWAVLSGNRKARFSRNTSPVRKSILNSLKKMMRIRIVIEDGAVSSPISGRFLPLWECPDVIDGFIWTEIPPLYRYAELINGEIIQLPVSLLHVYSEGKEIRYMPKPLLLHNRKPISVNCEDERVYYLKTKSGAASPIDRKHKTANLREGDPYTARVQSMLSPYIDTKHISREITIEKELPPIHRIQWKSTLEHTVLCHYLLHRISIFGRKTRGEFLNFDNLFALFNQYFTKPEQRNPYLKYQKVLALLCHYQSIDLIRFAGYITDFLFKEIDTDTGEIVRSFGTAFFLIEHNLHLEYWRTDDKTYILPKSFQLTWIDDPREAARNRKKSEKKEMIYPVVTKENGETKIQEHIKNYTPDTMARLGNVNIMNLTGVRMFHPLPEEYTL